MQQEIGKLMKRLLCLKYSHFGTEEYSAGSVKWELGRPGWRRIRKTCGGRTWSRGTTGKGRKNDDRFT